MNASLPRVCTTVLVCLFVWFSPAALAKEINKTMKTGISASAEYSRGESAKPALLILHGFLQTRHNATVHNLSEEFRAEGYSVLTPTLSLGITDRKRTLACEAPHPHSFEQDVREVAEWIDWLQSQGHKQIHLIGHSTGNIALLDYAKRYQNPAIKKIIAVSLVEYQREFGTDSNKKQIEQANRDATSGDTSLKSYKLSYCYNYLSPAKTYITYANWDMNRIIDVIHSLETPLYVIAGSADERMHDGWLTKLKSTNSIIKQIEGANHFFNSVYQFDLHDQVSISITD